MILASRFKKKDEDTVNKGKNKVNYDITTKKM